MRPTQEVYPVFEPNQVLTSGHLNQVFKYLDEQERLTRANLIGIGIVCGLNIRLDEGGSSIRLDAGCGITSEGYIAVEPDPVSLVGYREYELPKEVDYEPFRDQAVEGSPQYRLWELFGADEPNTQPLTKPAGFLDDKAVLLFVELKQEDLRNCSPSNCDDKGAKVTAKVRRLLITLDDLSEVVARSGRLSAGLTFADLEASLSERLSLPDLHLPRYDVPNAEPVSSQQVYAGFRAAFRSGNLALNTRNALSATYAAFKPLVESLYPADPFAGFGEFGFLDTLPVTTAQVRFLQYYYDFFDDLIHAYTELRSKGLRLLCSCCPSESLFPRHLMLGAIRPERVKTPGLFRHGFMASPAVGGCEASRKEFVQLFRRLVEMVKQFRNNPPLSAQFRPTLTDPQIRITPSKLGDVEISGKAIPYYYTQTGSPPLYELWNYEKSRTNRANQNLGYRSDEYEPEPPDFVTDALRYDIERNNFLRIEGHLGKGYKSVLNTLLTLKSRYRLPIEIIALRTGPFDENIAVDLTDEECHFQDLNTMYEALRSELVCSIHKTIQSVSNKKIDREIPVEMHEISHTELLIHSAVPLFEVKPDTIGALIASKGGVANLAEFLDIADKPLIEAATGTVRLLTELIAAVDRDLGALDWAAVEKVYEKLARWIENIKKGLAADEEIGELNWKDLSTEIAAVTYLCKLDAVKALRDEYVRRVRDVKQKQYLSHFLKKNPGIQHKAGVPLGGTFILVYHHIPEQVPAGPSGPFVSIATGFADTVHFSDAMTRISANPRLALDPDIRLVLGAFTGRLPEFGVIQPPLEVQDRIIREAVNELADGTVIADFYLPYLCNSDCPPIQYVLPAPKLALSAQVGCTSPRRTAEVTLIPQGGSAPFSYSLDGGAVQPLAGSLVLASGGHTIVLRDSAGAESSPVAVNVPEPLAIGSETYADDTAKQAYTVSFEISGGTPPYDSPAGTVAGTAFTSSPVKSGEPVKVEITDSRGCQVAKEFNHEVSKPCDLPCEGKARRCQHPFWLPEPEPERKLEVYKPTLEVFQFVGPDGQTLDIAKELRIDFPVEELNANFVKVIDAALKKINKVIAGKVKNPDWFVLGYQKGQEDRFGTLVVEHFACQPFTIRISEVIAFRKRKEERMVEYSDQGTVILIAGSEPVRIPLFGCEETNKCLPDHMWRPRCTGTDMKITVRAIAEGNEAILLAVPTGGTETPVQFLWEVEDAAPSLVGGTNARTRILSADPPTKRVRLTAFSQRGCIVTSTTTIKLG